MIPRWLRRVSVIFRWYDIWVGVFVDTNKRRVYIFPLPMVGVVVDCGKEL